MDEKELKKITETIQGYHLKDLRWLPIDNIIVGLVKDPIYGKPSLYDGYICCQWSKTGRPLKLNKDRKDLTLKIG